VNTIVSGLGTQSLYVPTNLRDTPESYMEAIEERAGYLPPGTLHSESAFLVHGGTVLDNDRTLGDSGVTNESSISIHFPGRGGVRRSKRLKVNPDDEDQHMNTHATSHAVSSSTQESSKRTIKPKVSFDSKTEVKLSSDCVFSDDDQSKCTSHKLSDETQSSMNVDTKQLAPGLRESLEEKVEPTKGQLNARGRQGMYVL